MRPHRWQPTRQEYWSGLPFPYPMHAFIVSHFSHVLFCVTLWTASDQAPLATGFSRQEYWNGLPFPSLVFLSAIQKNSSLSTSSKMLAGFFFFFFTMVILMNVKWNLMVISYIKHIFTYLLAICTYSLEKYFFNSFAHFKTQVFVPFLLSFKCSLYILDINLLSDV